MLGSKTSTSTRVDTPARSRFSFTISDDITPLPDPREGPPRPPRPPRPRPRARGGIVFFKGLKRQGRKHFLTHGRLWGGAGSDGGRHWLPLAFYSAQNFAL